MTTPNENPETMKLVEPLKACPHCEKPTGNSINHAGKCWNQRPIEDALRKEILRLKDQDEVVSNILFECLERISDLEKALRDIYDIELSQFDAGLMAHRMQAIAREALKTK